MKARLRISPQTIQVLDAFLEDPKGWKYGYDISRTTGLKSGTLYPILIRLAERTLLESCWETVEAGKPPRHMYRLTSAGVLFAREQLASRRPVRGRQWALGGVKR